MKRDVLLYLSDILEYIHRIEKSFENITPQEFNDSKDLQDATLRRIEVIGEALRIYLLLGGKNTLPYRGEMLRG